MDQRKDIDNAYDFPPLPKNRSRIILFSMIRLAHETIIFATLFCILLIWTVLRIVVNHWVDSGTLPVDHSPSNHTWKAA